MTAGEFFSVAKQSFKEWGEDRAPNEAAALAYYAMISVPALMLLIQWLLGQVVSDQVQEQVLDFVQQSVRGGGNCSGPDMGGGRTGRRGAGRRPRIVTRSRSRGRGSAK